MRTALAMLVMVLVFVTAANALSASIQPPRMVLRGNVSDMLTVYIDTRNPNTFPVTVNLTLVNLDNVKVIDDLRFFELAPNETRRVIFEVTIAKPDSHSGEAQFVFYPKERTNQLERGLALASQIITIAPGEETTTTTIETATTLPSEVPSPEFVSAVLVIGAIVTGVLLFMFFRR